MGYKTRAQSRQYHALAAPSEAKLPGAAVPRSNESWHPGKNVCVTITTPEPTAWPDAILR